MPGESHRQRSLAGYGPWDHKESDTTERLSLSLLSAACFRCGLEQGAYLLLPSFWFAAQVLSLTFLLWEMGMIRRLQERLTVSLREGSGKCDFYFLAMLGLRCHAGFSLVEWGLLTTVHGLLVAVASLAVSVGSGHTGFSHCRAWTQELRFPGFRAQAL